MTNRSSANALDSFSVMSFVAGPKIYPFIRRKPTEPCGSFKLWSGEFLRFSHIIIYDAPKEGLPVQPCVLSAHDVFWCPPTCLLACHGGTYWTIKKKSAHVALPPTDHGGMSHLPNTPNVAYLHALARDMCICWRHERGWKAINTPDLGCRMNPEHYAISIGPET